MKNLTAAAIALVIIGQSASASAACVGGYVPDPARPGYCKAPPPKPSTRGGYGENKGHDHSGTSQSDRSGKINDQNRERGKSIPK